MLICLKCPSVMLDWASSAESNVALISPQFVQKSGGCGAVHAMWPFSEALWFYNYQLATLLQTKCLYSTHSAHITHSSKAVRTSHLPVPASRPLCFSAVFLRQWQHRAGSGWSWSSGLLRLHHLWHQPADEAALTWGAHPGLHQPLLGHRQPLPAHPACP